MTDNDKRLIMETISVSCIDWYCINDLILRADTDEARSKLKWIMIKNIFKNRSK